MVVCRKRTRWFDLPHPLLSFCFSPPPTCVSRRSSRSRHENGFSFALYSLSLPLRFDLLFLHPLQFPTRENEPFFPPPARVNNVSWCGQRETPSFDICSKVIVRRTGEKDDTVVPFDRERRSTRFVSRRCLSFPLERRRPSKIGAGYRGEGQPICRAQPKNWKARERRKDREQRDRFYFVLFIGATSANEPLRPHDSIGSVSLFR